MVIVVTMSLDEHDNVSPQNYIHNFFFIQFVNSTLVFTFVKSIYIPTPNVMDEIDCLTMVTGLEEENER